LKIVGIDLALRNSACVSLDENGNYIDCKVITSTAEDFEAEDLLLYNCNSILGFAVDKCKNPKDELIVIIEGLAFSSVSLAKDIIAGNFWHVRFTFYMEEIEYHIVAPASWRARVFPEDIKSKLKADKKRLKDDGKTNGKLIKEAALSVVPLDVKKDFKKYLTLNKLNDKFMYDLADAYCIAKHGVLLYNESR
jgi:hypothetical protein